MASLNKATILGHLGKDPDVRATRDGKQIVSFSVATTESWKDKQTGEKKEKTEWHNVVIFSEGLAKVASQYLKKGSKVYVEGQLQTEKYTDKDGIDRYTTKIVLQGFNAILILLDSRGTSEGHTRPQVENNTPHSVQPTNFAADLDDDIPF